MILVHGLQVTILILIDGFLQSLSLESSILTKICHNPYFNRWFSAICKGGIWSEWNILVTILILIDGFLQYKCYIFRTQQKKVTILILIDGFLQYTDYYNYTNQKTCHNPYFNRWFSAIKIFSFIFTI